MPVNPDFKDLFAALNAEGVEYLLVGGYAMAVHDAPRFTKDLDVWVNPSASNPPRNRSPRVKAWTCGSTTSFTN